MVQNDEDLREDTETDEDDTDAISEEFAEFIKKNRDMVLKILDINEEKAGPSVSELREQYEVPIRESFTNGANTLVKMLADEDVQKHFIAGCMEMLMCFESLIKAAPLSDSSKEVVENAEKARDKAIKNVAITGAKTTTKSKLEKINIASVKKKIVDELSKDIDDE